MVRREEFYDFFFKYMKETKDLNTLIPNIEEVNIFLFSSF